MLNLIVTGHGEFALGMKSAMELIAGEQSGEYITFEPTVSLEDFQSTVALAIEKESATGDCFIFTDLLGGTPCNTVMMAASGKSNVHVYAGANLPMLIEFAGARMIGSSAEQTKTMLAETGKAGLTLVTLEAKSQELVEDGI
jgi:PTS system N-acetylgalactosamine-specific IIA component